MAQFLSASGHPPLLHPLPAHAGAGLQQEWRQVRPTLPPPPPSCLSAARPSPPGQHAAQSGCSLTRSAATSTSALHATASSTSSSTSAEALTVDRLDSEVLQDQQQLEQRQQQKQEQGQGQAAPNGPPLAQQKESKRTKHRKRQNQKLKQQQDKEKPQNAAAAVAAPKKQLRQQQPQRQQRPAMRQWPFDQLMLFWDTAFERNCETPTLAAAIRSAALTGHRLHGRGCVLVREHIRAKAKGAASGFGGGPGARMGPGVGKAKGKGKGKKGKAGGGGAETEEDEEAEGLRVAQEAVVVGRSVAYVPRSALHPDSMLAAAEAADAAEATRGGGGVGLDRVIDVELVVEGSHTRGGGTGCVSDVQEVAELTVASPADVLPMLRAIGDPTRLRALLADSSSRGTSSSSGNHSTGDPSNLPTLLPQVEESSAAALGEFGAAQALRERQYGGVDEGLGWGEEEPYNEAADELVLLLHVCIDGQEVAGADVVVATHAAATSDSSSTSTSSSSSSSSGEDVGEVKLVVRGLEDFLLTSSL